VHEVGEQLHGLARIAHDVWSRRLGRRMPALVGTALTFWFVSVAWIPFRAVGSERASAALSAYVLGQTPGTRTLGTPFVWVFPLLVALHLAARHAPSRGVWRTCPRWAFAAAYGVAVGMALPFVSVDFKPFLYFQF
jgi:hypothetical protein